MELINNIIVGDYLLEIDGGIVLNHVGYMYIPVVPHKAAAEVSQ